MGMKYRLAKLIKEWDCIKYGSFVLASGRRSNYKIDLDALFENPEGKRLAGEMGAMELKKLGDYEIAGVYRGGSLFAEAVSERLNKDYVSVDYKRNVIEGDIKPKEYVIFEDVTTTGGSVLKVATILRDYVDVRNAITVVDRQEGAFENLRENGIRLHSLLTKQDLGIIF
ncbi:MAG: orotate phosphoribosyltransferase [Candidatus Aenigmarchaeota archaeon]|nr:orotate phosphoribosyltransferase [Candidatus Aenigmarchaeota archaeon]